MTHGHIAAEHIAAATAQAADIAWLQGPKAQHLHTSTGGTLAAFQLVLQDIQGKNAPKAGPSLLLFSLSLSLSLYLLKSQSNTAQSSKESIVLEVFMILSMLFISSSDSAPVEPKRPRQGKVNLT